MKRIGCACVVALALAAPASAAAPPRRRLGAKKLHQTVSRAAIKAGPAIVQLVNYGEDDHNLRLRRIGGARVYKISVVSPGGTDVGELSAKLRPGRYKLWCSLAGHAARGMRATLLVKS